MELHVKRFSLYLKGGPLVPPYYSALSIFLGIGTTKINREASLALRRLYNSEKDRSKKKKVLWAKDSTKSLPWRREWRDGICRGCHLESGLGRKGAPAWALRLRGSSNMGRSTRKGPEATHLLNHSPKSKTVFERIGWIRHHALCLHEGKFHV